MIMRSTVVSASLLGVMLAVAAPALGQAARNDQQREQADIQQQRLQVAPLAHPADSAVGEVGQRQGVQQVAPQTMPMARVSSRIETRIDNRIRNRIDRSYTDLNDATAAIGAAQDRARTATQPQ